jgi:hypothetical protein
MNDQKEELPLSIVRPSNAEHYDWGDDCDGWQSDSWLSPYRRATEIGHQMKQEHYYW